MSDVEQATSDLDFVRHVVERREKRTRSPWWLGLMWGGIVLAGCVWNDFRPQTAWMFWSIAPMLGFVLSGLSGGREAIIAGEYDFETGRKMGLHWSTCFIGCAPVLVLAFSGKING